MTTDGRLLIGRRAFCAGAVAAAVGAATREARADDSPATAEALRARYAQPPSRFVTVDRVQLHVRDEGSGAAVLLLPGHLGNLYMFDAWMPKLTRHHRVIRVDWPPYGLSLPDPTGIYSTDRATTLVAGLIDELKLKKLALVGTSNGATVAAHYAARHPERVTRLALSTLPLAPPPPREPSPALKEEIARYGRNNSYRPPSYYRAFLEEIFADPAKVTDALVTLYTDVNNYPGGYDAVDDYVRNNRAMYAAGTLLELYREIRVPILVQWGDAGKVLPAAAAADAVAAFPNAPVVLRRYARSGHMPMLEQPEETVTDLIAFLDGKMDREARRHLAK